MKKIQNKLIAVITAIALTVAVVTGVLGLVITRVSTTTAIEQTLTETAEVAALAAQNMIATYTGCIGEMGRNGDLGDPAVPLADKAAIIQDRVEAYYMRSGSLANLNGIDLLTGANVSQEPFYQKAAAGSTYMSAPYITAGGDDAYMVVSAPVYFQGAVVGVVYFRCDTYLLQSIVAQVKVGNSENSDAYVLDGTGTTIAYVDQQSVLAQENVIAQAAAAPSDKKLQALAAIERRMIAGETGFDQYDYSDGKRYMQAYAPIPSSDGWSLAVTVDADEFMEAAHMGQLVQLGVFIVMLLLAFAAAAFIGRSIAKPIVQCAYRLRGLAEGDLHSPAPEVYRQDEIQVLADSTGELITDFCAIVREVGDTLGRIARGDLTCTGGTAHYPGDFAAIRDDLRAICLQLNQTMGGIITSSEQVAAGAGQVADAGTALASGSTEQAAAVEMLTSDIADLTDQIQSTAQGAQNASDSSRAAQGMLADGIQTMNELVEAVREIERNANEIFKILKVIDDIAFQTNILSLNAAVEAARAGSAGKGFAVVADEVRNLASKSAESARTSATLINRSVEATHQGAALAEKTAAVLQHVMEGADVANVHINEISAEAQRQAQAMARINDHIEQISSVQHSVAATSEESAATAEELARQADLVKEMISQFKLDPNQRS